RLAPHDRVLEPPDARPHPLRPGHRSRGPPAPHAAVAGRLRRPRPDEGRGDVHRAPRGAAPRRLGPGRRRGVRAGRPAEPALHGPGALLAQEGRAVTDTGTIELPRTGGPGSGLDDNWRVIVLNDNHNTFEGVAFALSSALP